MTETKLLTTEEVAAILKVSLEFVRRLLRDGKIRGRKVGREWRIEESELLRFIHGSELDE